MRGPLLSELINDWLSEEGLGSCITTLIRDRDKKLMGVVDNNELQVYLVLDVDGITALPAADPDFFDKLRVHLTTF